jgi:NAD(P)-dependent dehydrogenase (short-subunit alcohol dehydrogenase family)
MKPDTTMDTPQAFTSTPAPLPVPVQHKTPQARGFWSPVNPPITNWRGQRVWLIGASTGIGAATASALHARGAQVLVSARKAEALQAFAAAHTGPHAAQAWPLDVTDAEAVARTAQDILTEGPLDVVECFNPARNTCKLRGICKLSVALQQATAAFMAVLDDLTVADIAVNRQDLLDRLGLPAAAA